MTWDHRVIFHKNDPYEQWYGIHECFYDNPRDEIPTSWTEEPIQVISDSPEGLLWTLEKMRLAVEKAVLVIDGEKLKKAEGRPD